MIRSGKYSFDDDIWAQVSDDAKDLVSNLLVLDPSKRFSAKDALNHRWLLEDDDKLKSRSLDKTLKKLAQFNAKRKFRAAVGAVSLFIICIYFEIFIFLHSGNDGR